MDASTRLYKRLGEIPEDQNDPESLADLLVCAFGAFERYYVCWKTKDGNYRQDGYDLPPALRDWLYPTDGTTRDFASLQVVFGRGEEYFASDKNGKLEYKEPEIKKPVEDEEKPALRRARTVSFLRPLSDVSTRSETGNNEAAESKRSSLVSSRRASRPPSLSYSRTSSVASMFSDVMEQPSGAYAPRTSQPFQTSQWDALGQGDAPPFSSKRLSRSFDTPVEPISEALTEHSPVTTQDQRLHPRKIGVPATAGFVVPEGYMLVPIDRPPAESKPACICACHSPPLSDPMYISASTQTSISPSPLRAALRIDTTPTTHWSANGYGAIVQGKFSPAHDDPTEENPISMGRMMNFFSKPGYQLGDSLSSGYQTYQPSVYEYQEDFGEALLR